MTTVSVVIPVFNRAHLIAPAIDSVLGQSCAEISVDLIVVDDGSSDDLAGTLRQYGDKLTCIRHDRNSGAAAARNTGVAAARGEYVAFLDSDDEWLLHKLALQISMMRDRNWVASCTAYYLARSGSAARVSPALETGTLSLSDLVWGCFVSPGSTLVFKRDLFEKVGPLDTRLGRLEDWDWLLRYAQSQDLAFIAEPLARIHVTPMTNSAPVVAALDAMRSKHAGKLRRRDRRHFEAALDFEKAAALYRSGRIGKALPAFLKSWARSPISHPALAAVLHNRAPRN